MLPVTHSLPAAAGPWEGAREVQIPSTLDGALQGAFFYVPPEAEPGGAPAPLMVALHTWSADYRQAASAAYLAACKRRGWVLIHPNFRGPNHRPEACASDLAVQDVLDAVAYARAHASVDPGRIYLCGASGGGFMSLTMAHRAPDVWAGVSAWVPISDLAAWHRHCTAQKLGYAQDIERSCGGSPSQETEAEYRRRSPLFHLAAARGVPIDLNAGIHDGHLGSVPISHALYAYNALARANGHPEAALTEEQIAVMTQERRVPEALANENEGAPYRKGRILFRRQAGPVRITLFEGGHESDEEAAAEWLAEQTRH